MYKIVHYRIRVVRYNLESSFPEKSKEELRRIERKFYHWLSDYAFEALKLLTISDEELRRHFDVRNTEEVEHCMAKGQNTAAILGHYCNWEWLSTMGLWLPKERVPGLIYKPLRNKTIDKLFISLRSAHGGGIPVPKNEILRYIVKYRKEGKQSLFGYIADQAPKWKDIHAWLPFLNHDTPVFSGSERIMRKMGDAVFFVEMTRPRRGYYTCTFRLISEDASKMPEGEITRLFFTHLEESIRYAPEYYLWSHDRWKRTHEEFNRRFIVEHGRVIEK